MRLCLIANPNSMHTVRWVRYFAGRGHDVHLIGEKPLAVALPGGITFHDLTRRTNVRKLRYATWSRAVRRLVREVQPDVLHAHQVASAGWLGAATGYHPFLVTSWGSDLLLGARRSLVQRQLARWVLGRADYVTCVSQPLAEAAHALGVPAHKVEVVHWGVDTEVFHAGDASSDLSMTEAAAPLVLSIRGMRSIYNPLVIAQAIPAVLAQRLDARFVIRTYSVDTDLLARFQDIIHQSGAAGAVEYVGDLPDDHAIADLYRQAAVAISVPFSDGTPQSVLEAMACGAAPVVSDLPSLRDWLRPDVEGLFVPVDDAGALAAAILRLLGDDILRRSVQAAAVRLVQERADSRLWMQRYEQIYQQLAAGQRPQPPVALSIEAR
jgi:glycosyltransferase involved in cell wall biosynthesis